MGLASAARAELRAARTEIPWWVLFLSRGWPGQNRRRGRLRTPRSTRQADPSRRRCGASPLRRGHAGRPCGRSVLRGRGRGGVGQKTRPARGRRYYSTVYAQGNDTTAKLPGVAIAAPASLGFGAVIGPEAPIVQRTCGDLAATDAEVDSEAGDRPRGSFGELSRARATPTVYARRARQAGAGTASSRTGPTRSAATRPSRLPRLDGLRPAVSNGVST